MNPLPSGETCPVDLNFPEPNPVRLDLAPIIRHGRSIRRRRRITTAAAAMAACAAAASVIAGTRGATFRWFPPAAVSGPGTRVTPVDALVATDPPVTGKLTLVSNWPRHWDTVAWATRRGDVCWAAYHTPMAGASEGYMCPGWSGTDIPGAGRQNLSPLLPATAPFSPETPALVPELGLVTPRAVRVTVTFAARDFSAGVVTVPLGGGKTIGVYLIWLRVPPGSGGYGSNDVSGAIAYDAAGRIVARHGPGM